MATLTFKNLRVTNCNSMVIGKTVKNSEYSFKAESVKAAHILAKKIAWKNKGKTPSKGWILEPEF
tara:strand:+ start:1599 stop:1793 length:195 start_codon:yes stop_codon:yes gene_type:complete